MSNGGLDNIVYGDLAAEIDTLDVTEHHKRFDHIQPKGVEFPGERCEDRSSRPRFDCCVAGDAMDRQLDGPCQFVRKYMLLINLQPPIGPCFTDADAKW